MNSSQDEEKSHDCDLNHCFKSADFEISVLALENRLEKKDIGHSVVVASQSHLMASLTAEGPAAELMDIRHDPPKVPLYIIYQKLLLP